MDKKGIPYFTDVAASQRRLKYHKRGYKNIYTLVLDYHNDKTNKFTQVAIPYGRFDLAHEKVSVERSAAPGWGGIRLLGSELVVSTYRGMKKLHEEHLLTSYNEDEEER